MFCCLSIGFGAAEAQTVEPFKGTISNLDTKPDPPPYIPPPPPKDIDEASVPAPVVAKPVPRPMPPQAENYAPAPQAETPKMTKKQKWARAFLIMGAVAGQVAIIRRCQQLRNKPLYLYRGGDLQDLQWCVANGY